MPVTIEELPSEELEQQVKEVAHAHSGGTDEEEEFFDAHSDDGGSHGAEGGAVVGERPSPEPEACPDAGCTGSSAPAGPDAGVEPAPEAALRDASRPAPQSKPEGRVSPGDRAESGECVVHMTEAGPREVEAPGSCIKDSSRGAEGDAGAAAASGAIHPGSDAGVEVAGAPPEEPVEEELSEEEKQEMLLASEALKQEGNTLFGQQRFQEASQKYTEAVIAAPPNAPEAAVYYANRAACMMKLELWKDAAEDCTHALKLKEGYVKALLRRCASYEKLDDVESALLDAKKIAELEPSNREAAATAARLEPIVNERREKLKDEMMGKLKDLGNVVLGKFGLSLDNFQTVQDPATGGYSINFKQ